MLVFYQLNNLLNYVQYIVCMESLYWVNREVHLWTTTKCKSGSQSWVTSLMFGIGSWLVILRNMTFTMRLLFWHLSYFPPLSLSLSHTHTHTHFALIPEMKKKKKNLCSHIEGGCNEYLMKSNNMYLSSSFLLDIAILNVFGIAHKMTVNRTFLVKK